MNDRRDRLSALAQVNPIRLDLKTCPGCGRADWRGFDPPREIPRIPIHIEFQEPALQDLVSVARDLEETVRSIAIDLVSCRGGAIGVDEDSDRVGEQGWRPSTLKNRSGDFHIERQGCLVVDDAHPDDIDVGVGRAAPTRVEQAEGRPVVESAIDHHGVDLPAVVRRGE